jgi:pyrimidine oxygenase
MNVGVFIPIGNNGWLISENSPQYMPSFDLNKEIVLRAEQHGLEFALSMIKLRGFGGKTEFWDYNLESFTLMAGLASVTTRIKLYATVATLCTPPAFAARMAMTIDSISHGRFGLNIITGWQRPEYAQMGLWPGDDYFNHRYEYLNEYVQIMQELWSTGRSDLKGNFFQMDDCRVQPKPQAHIDIICAGQSAAGLEFTAKFADYNFCLAKGVNTPTAFSPIVERLHRATAETGRNVTCYALFMIIAAATDQAAMEKWEFYKAGADTEALAWLTLQANADAAVDTNIKQAADPTSAVNINMGTLVGSYEHIAEMLDEVAEIPGVAGVLLTFDDFLVGMDDFGMRIQPLMNSRRHVNGLVAQ